MIKTVETYILNESVCAHAVLILHCYILKWFLLVASKVWQLQIAK